jgi:hypothetical protein
MATQCFMKKGSDPPICGVHHVRLEKKPLPDELITFGYSVFTFLVCPVSGAVVNTAAKHS